MARLLLFSVFAGDEARVASGAGPRHTPVLREESRPRFVSGPELDHASTWNESSNRYVRRDEEADMGLPGLIRTAVLIGMGTLWLLIA